MHKEGKLAMVNPPSFQTEPEKCMKATINVLCYSLYIVLQKNVM